MNKQKVKIFNSGLNESPSYETLFSAGFDFRADFSKIDNIDDLMGNKDYLLFDNDKKILTILPGGRVLIPTGLYISLPDGYELQVRPRSGLAIKNGITVLNSPGTIDCDYLGEVKIILLNTDTINSFVVNQGDRIAQGVLNKVEQIEWEKVKFQHELGSTERGEGGFGHTGTK